MYQNTVAKPSWFFKMQQTKSHHLLNIPRKIKKPIILYPVSELEHKGSLQSAEVLTSV
jgi:hypothetical protein